MHGEKTSTNPDLKRCGFVYGLFNGEVFWAQVLSVISKALK